MATDEGAEQNALLRGIIASVVAGSGAELTQGAGGTENVAQLIAAAMTQLTHNIANLQEASERQEDSKENQQTIVAEQEQSVETPSEDISFNPVVTGLEDESSVGGPSSPVAAEKATASGKQKQICLKLPIETRKRIIAMRKEGKKCKEIAKELGVSVSGAQKVWERFLATGKVHDRKPSEYAGRPRKPVAFHQMGNDVSSPSALAHHVHVGSADVVSQSDDIQSIEYTTVSEGISDPPIATEEAVVISGESEIYVGGPLDMPGATVEIVETEPIPTATPSERKQPTKKKSEYREQLLLRLIEGCPLALLREEATRDNSSNPHVLNLSTSIARPLYMESVLGHPFGRVPVSKPFETDLKEAEVILSDPVNPVGKDLIAALGYSTKVYFNACCKPSPLFDPNKVHTALPFCVEAGYLADTMQKVLQLFLDLSKDPLASLEHLPNGDGPALSVKTQDGQQLTKRFPSPIKLSEYWSSLYRYASQLECCENFLSASIPSAPCLLCHPFEKLAQTLEIKDQEESDYSPSSLHPSSSSSCESSMGAGIQTHTVDSLTHHVEVQVLESGRVAVPSVSVACNPTTEPTSAVAKESMLSPQDAQTPPTIPAGIPLRVGLSSGSRRRHLNVGTAAIKDDQVEVDGQFDMPIPDSASSSSLGVVTTGNNPEMTFVMTSEGFSQTIAVGEGEGQRGGSVAGVETSTRQNNSELQTQGLRTTPRSRSPDLPAEISPPAVSIDAATQTSNCKSRLEVRDRTPLIIRRSRAGKTQKSSTQQTPAGGINVTKSTESSTGNGNETRTQARREVHIQTQSSLEVETVSAPSITETHLSSHLEEQAKTTPPRRSARKNKSSPKHEVKSSSPTRRLSPRKSPIQSGTNSDTQVIPRIRTRAAAKRTSLEGGVEKGAPPPAKRTRRAGQKANSGREEMKHPQTWTVEEVADWIASFQSDCTEVFKEHEVDGESLFSLDPEMMVKLMNLKTGPALKIHRKIAVLKKQHGVLPLSS